MVLKKYLCPLLKFIWWKLLRETVTMDFVGGERDSWLNFENIKEKREFIAKEHSGHRWIKITERKHQM